MKKTVDKSAICVLSHQEISDLYNCPEKYNCQIVQLEYAYNVYFLAEVIAKDKDGDKNE